MATVEEHKKPKAGEQVSYESQSDTPEIRYAINRVMQAGKILKKDNTWNHLGSIVVHIYKGKEMAFAKPTFEFRSQAPGLKHIPESVAIEAIKALGADLMKRFGRQVPRWRK